jgi:CubicO group peptidase (beta-lactamase class C family)
MRLTEQKKIRLDKDLGTYLPDYKNSNKKDIPLRELLAHHGGLKAWIPFWKACKESNDNWKPLTFSSDSSANYPYFVVNNLFLHKNYRDTIFKQILESPVAEKKYVYSDLGFYLYPKIIEQKTKKNFEQYIAENFFRPLGANSLIYNPLKRFSKEKIVPTEYDSAFRKTLLHGTVNDEGAAMTGGVSGHAGLFGTANDAAKMMQMYLDKGIYGGIRFFKEKTLAEFLRCQFCEAGNRRALGFDRVLINYNEKDSYTAKSASQSSFGHTGFTGTFLWADPKNGLLVVVMSNRVNPSRNNRKLMELNIRPRLHQTFYDFFSK